MALTTTTLASAVLAADTAIVLTSATGVSAGSYFLVDQEIMQAVKSYVSGTTVQVLRGLEGTIQSAHKASANITLGASTDFSLPVGPTVTTYPVVRGRTMTSYSAAGAIALPNAGSDAIAVINGTGALAMTLANPTKDMDGCMLWIIANGKAAHTVTYSAGVGNGGGTMDVGTYNATEATGCALVACNGFWVLWANGIGSAGTQVAGVVWA